MEDFIAGMCVILLFVCIGFGVSGSMHQSETNELIAECEAELPRNESCVLIAVPVTKGEG
jgi:hypothetical protein